MTPAQFSARMLTFEQTLLPGLGIELRDGVFSRWGAGSINHMRDDPPPPARRSPEDQGDLRIVFGNYAKATRTGGIREVEQDGLQLTFRKGFDPESDPGAYNERPGIKTSRPARPTLQPGLEDSLPGTISIAKKRFHAAIRRAVR